ncbi:MAG: bifunctional phosphoribosylaminoimidazolecarboxamide formyltransferase/IMP cyclohydrolase [Anaerolineae bacterium]|nr:bifunctional phosphoribosylaminoimidazolecarboxamide formyltransferase/IMP cyclohydrolase [Anaerolineae bacterium]
MPRALLSVSDKTGLIDFASQLSYLGFEIVASGGTAQTLQDAGLKVTSVEKLTGAQEMLGGRVKTLHPAVHAGILSRRTPQDNAELESAGYEDIELVICNLYPFQQTIAKPGITLQDAIEQIDIGGVALLRAAAKNFLNVTVVCDPADYDRVAAALAYSNEADLALRRDLAIKAFAHTRDYDTAIHAFLSRDLAPNMAASDALPPQLSIAAHQVETLRYGENPHQSAAYYSQDGRGGPLGGTVLGGKQLSYNNILDLDAAWRAVSSYDVPAVVIVKHLNPTGIATGATIADAYPAALASDSLSAFGGVIAVNQTVDEAFVSALGSLFIEAIAAPSFRDEAVAQLSAGRKNCRLLQVPQPFDGTGIEIRTVHRGLLVQRSDMGDPDHTLLKTVTLRTPTGEEMTALRFGWKAVQHVKSNAIVIAGANTTYGIGGGLSSRVDSVKLAVEKAGERAQGAVLASDAFFPFPDGIETAGAAGITAIIQPGGSIRDSEVIETANRLGMAMIFTGTRHFRH